MGHSGAFTSSFMGDVSAEDKLKAFREAGIQTITHPGQAGERMKQLLATTGRIHSRKLLHRNQQTRKMHTLRLHRPANTVPRVSQIQAKQYQIGSHKTIELLRGHDIPVFTTREISRLKTSSYTEFSLCFAICRRTRSPCIIVSSPQGSFPKVSLPFPYNVGPDEALVRNMLTSMHSPIVSDKSLLQTLQSIYGHIFQGKEAFLIEVERAVITAVGQVRIESRDGIDPGIRIYFDDAAYKSCERHSQTYSLRDEAGMAPEEVQAGANGIVYIKLAKNNLISFKDDTNANHATKPQIGCLVNGAGLAMNTNDVLVHYGGSPVNFIDTGGKATKATIKECFRLILLDKRAKAIFVNIFGGLTLCDMIASGIILAFQEYREQLAGIPVVVRLRGTNEEEGQKMLRESNLPGVYAFDDLDAAAKEVIKLAERRGKDDPMTL